MDNTTLLLSIALFIIAYPFTVYFKLKSLNKNLMMHWQSIEQLLGEYENNKSAEILRKIDNKRRAYNALVRANDHKLDSTIGNFIAQKYNFEKKEHFEFKA